jgi:hypothetical protein
MQDFKNPSVEGDFRGSGRLVVSRLTSAVEKAKAEVEQLNSENADQKNRIAALELRNSELERANPKGGDDFGHHLPT